MAVAMSKEVQQFISGKLGWVATADAQGMPNVTPKGTIQVLDDITLLFADLFCQKTCANLRTNAKIAVTVVDTAHLASYQLKGTAELLGAGPLYDEIKAQIASMALPLPMPVYAVKITVEAIYDQSPGPNAGKRIA